MPPWEYDPNLFVDRETIRKEIEQWVNDASDKRAFSLIDSPGTGKTWLLNNLYEKWKGETISGRSDRLVFWLDIPDVVNKKEKQRDLILKKEKIFKWLEAARGEALGHCAEIRAIDRTVPDPSRAVEDFIEDLCQCCDLANSPVFILDGYDELSDSAAETVCDRLIHYLTIRDCTRILLAYREEQRLYFGAPRFSQRSASMESRISDEKQFCRLTEAHGDTTLPSNLNDWKTSLKNYPWTHPFINAFLFECAWQGNGQPLRSLTVVDLRKCCNELITRPDGNGVFRHLPLHPSDFDLLKQIAEKCPPEWTSFELEENTGQRPSSEAVKRLVEYGLVAINSTTHRQKIADGLRELLRDLVAMEAHP